MKVDIELRERLQVVPWKSCRQSSDQSVVDACGVGVGSAGVPNAVTPPPLTVHKVQVRRSVLWRFLS